MQNENMLSVQGLLMNIVVLFTVCKVSSFSSSLWTSSSVIALGNAFVVIYLTYWSHMFPLVVNYFGCLDTKSAGLSFPGLYITVKLYCCN